MANIHESGRSLVAISTIESAIGKLPDKYLHKVNLIGVLIEDSGKITESELPSGVLTQFALLPTATKYKYVDSRPGRLFIDPLQVLTASTDHLQADLVRTAAVASQYPNNGFDDRMSNVMKRAIEIQREFLENEDKKIIPLDPRFMDLSYITNAALGRVASICDVGIEDMVQAMRADADILPRTERLIKLANDSVRFARVRESVLECISENKAEEFLKQYGQETLRQMLGKAIYMLVLKST